MHRNKREKQVSAARTVKGGPEKVLRAAKLLHPNLQFTIETQNTNGKLAFLDL